MSGSFNAEVQYGDWKGECHADDADSNDLRKVLRTRNLIKDDEFVFCVKFLNAENLSATSPLAPVFVSVYTVAASNYAEAKAVIDRHGPIEAREVLLELTVEEFAHLFKRLSIVLSWQAFNVIGRQFKVLDEHVE